ncbi:hypothetical protein VTK73DRAFT_4952 [Phialemonium thermophilum]|uniref:Protein kinase domain-containing protein n=1 Tax=Phialemonium thermophilum TaxID=223376 RepID=A0ABR3WR88_9PEZI
MQCITIPSQPERKLGRAYRIEKVLSDRRNPLLCVYQARYERTDPFGIAGPSTLGAYQTHAASADGKPFVLKHVIPGDLEYQLDLQGRIECCPHLRTAVDTVVEPELFVYPFLATDLLQLSTRPAFSDKSRRAALRCALTGLAELHDRSIIHTDIKPNNILVDYEESSEQGISIQSVQIGDLEDAVLLEPGHNLKGCVCGNQLWRSPEAWTRARQNTPSDIFSFGVVMIYVMLNQMVLRPTDEELASPEAWRHVLRRQISYFADNESFVGLLKHIGEDNPYFEGIVELGTDFGKDRPRKPFALWEYVDAEFRDLVGKMTNWDPTRRITAREALAHSWFQKGQ